MKGYLLVVARDALADAPDDAVLPTLRECVTGSRNGVLVLVHSLAGVTGQPEPAGASRPGVLVAGGPPPYDGRPLRSLLLRLPTRPDALTSFTEWLRREDAEVVDLPLELSGHLLQVVTVTPRSADLSAHAARSAPPW